MRIRFEVTEYDLLAYHRHVAGTAPETAGWRRRHFGIFATVAFLVTAMIAFEMTERKPLDELMPFVVVGGGGLLLYAVWLYDALKKGGDRAFYKALRSGAYDSELGWHDAVLANGRLTIETDFAGAVRRMARDDRPPEAETGIKAV